MFLSRVEIDLDNRRKTRELSHLGAFHSWVEESFPEEFKNEDRSRKLWRIDKIGGREILLIVSQEKPDIKLLEKYGVADSGQTKSYSDYIYSLKEGMVMDFRITLNPVKSISSGSGSKQRGRVVPHVTEEHQRMFLLERSEKNGFELQEDQFFISESGLALLKRKKDNIRLIKVSYQGILTITNADKFMNLLKSGMGKKKAYGFGMMTVVPIK